MKTINFIPIALLVIISGQNLAQIDCSTHAATRGIILPIPFYVNKDNGSYTWYEGNDSWTTDKCEKTNNPVTYELLPNLDKPEPNK